MSVMATERPVVQDVPEPPPVAPAPAATPGVDPAAPYGRTPGGRIRKRPVGKRGRKPGSRTSVIGASGSQRRTPTKPKDYRPTILGMSQMVCVPIAFKAPVDAAVISHYMEGDGSKEFPGIARAVSDLAVQHPEVAAVLDRLAVAGPYTALFSAVLPLGIQLLVNHGRLPLEIGTKFGATDPEEIRQQLAAEAKAA